MIILHRGNTNGPSNDENNPKVILKHLLKGYNVEVDVWCKNDQWFLGHDGPDYNIDQKLLLHPNIWCHAKTVDTLHYLLSIEAHCFYHEKDLATLTSKGFIWLHENFQNNTFNIPDKAVIVTNQPISDKYYGICTDYVQMV